MTDEKELVKYGILKAQGDLYARTGDVRAFMQIPKLTPTMKHYVVIWSRLANAGYAFIEAENPVEAVKKLGYSPKFCKMTAVEIVNHAEVYTEGVEA